MKHQENCTPKKKCGPAYFAWTEAGELNIRSLLFGKHSGKLRGADRTRLSCSTRTCRLAVENIKSRRFTACLEEHIIIETWKTCSWDSSWIEKPICGFRSGGTEICVQALEEAPKYLNIMRLKRWSSWFIHIPSGSGAHAKSSSQFGWSVLVNSGVL